MPRLRVQQLQCKHSMMSMDESPLHANAVCCCHSSFMHMCSSPSTHARICTSQQHARNQQLWLLVDVMVDNSCGSANNPWLQRVTVRSALCWDIP
jgi:hypothetical protein